MICQKKAIRKFFATVVSQDGMKSMRAGLWNMSVAQKLMMGHIIDTVTAALNVVLTIASESSSVLRAVILAVIGSAMKNDMMKHRGIMNTIS